MQERTNSSDAGEALEERLVKMAVRVMHVCENLGGSFSGRHVASQLLRCGTSPAANYSEARSAESRADFIHKVRIALKELNETSVWLRITAGSGLISRNDLALLIEEANELRRILGASVRTAKVNEAANRIVTPNKR